MLMWRIKSLRGGTIWRVVHLIAVRIVAVLGAHARAQRNRHWVGVRGSVARARKEQLPRLHGLLAPNPKAATQADDEHHEISKHEECEVRFAMAYRIDFLFNVTGAREAVRRVIFVVTVLVEPGFVPNVVVHVFVKVAAEQD